MDLSLLILIILLGVILLTLRRLSVHDPFRWMRRLFGGEGQSPRQDSTTFNVVEDSEPDSEDEPLKTRGGGNIKVIVRGPLEAAEEEEQRKTEKQWWEMLPEEERKRRKKSRASISWRSWFFQRSPGRRKIAERKREEELRRMMEEERGRMETSTPAGASEPVRLGASAPKAAHPGDEFIARFVAYTPEEEQQVRAELQELSPDEKPHLGLRECQWQHGTRVTVRVTSRSPHLEIDEAEQEFIWMGKRVLRDFGVYVAEDAPNKTASLKFSVAIDGIVVASFRLKLTITTEATPAEQATVTAKAARTAFASYASKDRLRVLDRVAAVRIAADLDIFLDCLSLRPGDRWKNQLRQEIDARDLFLLFWSDDAKASEWVEWEWRTALAEKGLDAIQLHPLDLVDEAPPPDELNDLHFGDAYILARKAEEGRR